MNGDFELKLEYGLNRDTLTVRDLGSIADRLCVHPGLLIDSLDRTVDDLDRRNA
jgi:hypothetical protein